MKNIQIPTAAAGRTADVIERNIAAMVHDLSTRKSVTLSERQGNNLVIKMSNGETVIVENFFLAFTENDFHEMQNGLYKTQVENADTDAPAAAETHQAEDSADSAPAAGGGGGGEGLGGGMAAVGALGLMAAAAGGGGGGSSASAPAPAAPQDEPEVIIPDQDGAAAGIPAAEAAIVESAPVAQEVEVATEADTEVPAEAETAEVAELSIVETMFNELVGDEVVEPGALPAGITEADLADAAAAAEMAAFAAATADVAEVSLVEVTPAAVFETADTFWG